MTLASVQPGGPRLTIGMPVFNNARTIRRALDSLVTQSYPNFRLLISDDGSTDGTIDICEEYARSDARVDVVRQPKTLNYGNFRYVLQSAATPLFMFAAGDDYWHHDYVARMIDALDRDPQAVCAVSQVAFMRDGALHGLAAGTKELTADPTTNIISFLAACDDNSRMYGVFRTGVAQRAFPRRNFHAYDWAFSAGTLREGTHIEVPEVLMWRDRTDPHRYTEYVRRDARNPVGRWFPMLPLTWDLLRRLRIPASYRMTRELFWLNVNFHLTYLRRYHPSVAPISERGVSWFARASRRVKGVSRR